jgi:hypothetical protein
MSRWAKDLVVTTERDGFRIADPDRLSCLGGEDLSGPTARDAPR